MKTHLLILIVFLILGGAQHPLFATDGLYRSSPNIKCDPPPLGLYREATPKLYKFEFNSGLLDGGTGDLDNSDPHFRFDLHPLKEQQDSWESIYCRGEVQLEGMVIGRDGRRFMIEQATLTRHGKQVSFVTETIENAKYAFQGTFPEKPRRDKGLYIRLTGTLTIYNGAALPVESEVKFISWGLQ